MDLLASNGAQQRLPNGIPAKPPVEQNGGHIRQELDNAVRDGGGTEREDGHGLSNGVAEDGKQNGSLESPRNRLDGLPIEIRQLTQHFQPFHKLIHRSVQQTWNSFSDLIDQLSEINVAPSVTAPNASYAKPQINGAASGDQSHENMEKKDRLLKFQHDQRAMYIKLLVLHDWYKKSRGIGQAIEISMWIHDQRAHFAQAADFIGNMKRELALWQVPNPDLRTAIEILSRGSISTLSDLGYIPRKPLCSQEMLRTLQDINILLCTRLSLYDQVPLQLSNYRIHDGRVTFIAPQEFELDLSVADGNPSSQFYFIDLRYLFLQRSMVLHRRLQDEFAAKVNEVLRTDGLLGCYDFLHDLTLSYRLNSLRRQALDMARKQWSENLRVDLINRTLVVQYWLNRLMPKSWIELGIQSGRRKKRRDGLRSKDSFLDLRWMPEKKEKVDAQADFNISSFSTEEILHYVIARHSSIILDGLYEKLLECRLYADGKLLLELSCSDAEPSACSLRIQLTHTRHVVLAIEPISGSLILQPASSLSGRTEFELNRLQSPVEEGLQHLTMLRCLAAEQEIAQQAKIAGWEVLQTFPLSRRELRSLFLTSVQRYLLIRQASWRPNVMVAATVSMEGDKWWLLYPTGQESVGDSAMLASQRIDCSPALVENETDSLSFFSRLQDYASGAIALKVNEQELSQRGLSSQLRALPKFQKDFQLPLMKVQYLIAHANRALKPSSPDTGLKAQTGIGEATEDCKNNDQPSWIHPTVYLKFCGLNKMTHNTLLLAKGRTTASAKVLESLNCLTGSNFKVKKDKGEFLTSFQVPIGNSVISELFSRLQNFDSLLSLLTMVKSFNSVWVQSLSLSRITFEYNREARLVASIGFPSPTSSITVRLLPEHYNPHARISSLIESLLADRRRPFTANLGGVLTMLSTTYPLLILLDELERRETSADPAAEIKTTSSSSTIRLHVIARSPTHYALQYFDLSIHSHTMIARFEVFRHLRRDTPVWILRPALEETVSYSRSSFVDTALKQKLVNEVFTVRDALGWLSLDTGASCPIDSPGPLVRKVDDVVRVWAKESPNEILGAGQRPESASKNHSRDTVNGPKSEPSIPSDPAQHQHQQQQQQQGVSRPVANGNGPSRPAPNGQRPHPQGQQRPKDVITLD